MECNSKSLIVKLLINFDDVVKKTAHMYKNRFK